MLRRSQRLTADLHGEPEQAYQRAFLWPTKPTDVCFLSFGQKRALLQLFDERQPKCPGCANDASHQLLPPEGPKVGF